MPRIPVQAPFRPHNLGTTRLNVDSQYLHIDFVQAQKSLLTLEKHYSEPIHVCA